MSGQFAGLPFGQYADDEEGQLGVPFLDATTVVYSPTLVAGNATTDARTSQLPVEALTQSNDLQGRISQLPVEVLSKADNAQARISQLPVEVLVASDVQARLSQLPVEVLYRVLYEDIYVAVID